MLLTRRACYGLLAAQHLAEHAGEGSFSANDLAEFYGLPHEALAKILQRLAAAGLLMSHHGIKGGYTLACDPRYISVFDVIKSSDRPRRSSLHSERQQRLGTGNGYHPLRMVSQLVEDMLRELTIEDIEEKASTFSLSSSSCCTTGSISKTVESCSEPGTTRTSKIRPAGRSPNVTRLPSENSKTSRFGSGLRAPLENESRYSPAKCIGCSTKDVSGNPDPKHVSTSFVQRQNWSVRTSMRRYTRLSNGFSRKLENHAAATALNYFAYNFIKIHRTLRMSPAMAAGITDRLWDVTDLVALWESYERRTERAA